MNSYSYQNNNLNNENYEYVMHNNVAIVCT